MYKREKRSMAMYQKYGDIKSVTPPNESLNSANQCIELNSRSRCYQNHEPNVASLMLGHPGDPYQQARLYV